MQKLRGFYKTVGYCKTGQLLKKQIFLVNSISTFPQASITKIMQTNHRQISINRKSKAGAPDGESGIRSYLGEALPPKPPAGDTIPRPLLGEPVSPSHRGWRVDRAFWSHTPPY